MTPQQKLKHAVILRGVELGCIKQPAEEITAENVDDLFESLGEDWELRELSRAIEVASLAANDLEVRRG